MPELAAVRFGLYYPFIHFRSDEWLKMSALCWDRIGRIVPPGYTLEDSNTVRVLKGELDFVRDISPDQQPLDDCAEEFMSFITRFGDRLRALYGVVGRVPPTHIQTDVFSRQSWPSPKRWAPPWTNVAGRGGWLPFGGESVAGQPEWRNPLDPTGLPPLDPSLAYVYTHGKIARLLELALIEADLGVAVPPPPGLPIPGRGLLGMHPQLAFVYMHSLANKISQSVMSLITDDDYAHVAAGCSSDDLASDLLDLPDSNNSIGGVDDLAIDFAMLAFQSILPKDIGSVSVEAIVHLRQKYPDELMAFQDSANALIQGLPEAVAAADEKTRRLYLEALQAKTIAPRLRELKRSLNSAGIDTVFGAVGIKVQGPELVTSSAAVLGIGALHLNPVMMGAGAIGLCLAARSRGGRKKGEEIRKNSSVSFLLRVEEDLNPTSLLKTVSKAARRVASA